MAFHVPEEKRLTSAGAYSSTSADGNNGTFLVEGKINEKAFSLYCIASDGGGWEHVSVSPTRPKGCPSWDHMCHIKNLFWDEGDLVVQYHPKKEDYVNCHPNCLHLWRKAGTNDFCECPPKQYVGPE